MEPDAPNAGTCDRSAPCSQIEYAISQASISRSHLVYALGTYLEPADVDITPARTSAPGLTFHGGGATISGSSEDTIGVTIPTAFRDLTILNTGAGRALSTGSSGIVLERVNIVSGGTGLTIDGSVTARAIPIEARFAAISLFNGGSLDIDGATLSSEVESVVDAGLANPTSILMKNTLIFGTTDIGVSLQSTQGALEFVTITNVGSASPNSTAGLQCSAALSVRNSIVWTPLVGKSPITGGCNLTNVMAGPMAVAGAANQDPLFVNVAAEDFHLGPNSPARDAANAGPAFDFEGDPRPQGMRFDLGADESE